MSQKVNKCIIIIFALGSSIAFGGKVSVPKQEASKIFGMEECGDCKIKGDQCQVGETPPDKLCGEPDFHLSCEIYFNNGNRESCQGTDTESTCEPTDNEHSVVRREGYCSIDPETGGPGDSCDALSREPSAYYGMCDKAAGADCPDSE